MAKKVTWHKIGESVEDLNFSAAGLVQLTVAGRSVCVAKTNRSFYACAAKCPHAGGQLADGYTDMQDNIVCPLHRYKFSLETGRNTTGEGYYLKRFPIEVKSDGVYIGFEESNFFNW